MSLFNNAITGASGNQGYSIARSVRLRSSATAYFNRTPSTNGSQTTWTWSNWVKRGTLGTVQRIFNSVWGTTDDVIRFTASDTIDIYINNTSGGRLITSAVYRDPSAWYHIVVVWNSTNATSSDRLCLYVNGVRVTAFSTASYPTQNYTATGINSANSHMIGRYVAGSSEYFDGYLTEINFIDGQALTPSSFGETDSITGVWKAKKYSGTYGTNGFYLNFSDNSSNTATTIGKDYSGNGNNWTPNNISVTSGVTYDSMVDSPTTSAVSSNYPVSNVLDIDRSNITTSNGNLTLTKATANDSPRAACTFGATSGKFYAEITWTSITNTTPNDNYVITGVTTKENWTDSSNGYNAVLYLAANNGLAANGQKGIWTAGSFAASSYGTGYFVSGTVIGIALNLDAGTVTFYLNNVSQGAITLPTTTQPWFFYNTSDGTGNGYTANWNFGQRPFTYTPPTGFVALNTYNLPASTITNGAAYMAATTYTGTGSALTISNAVNGVSMQPDFIWIKPRSIAGSHGLFDSVRGYSKSVRSNDTRAEDTSPANTDLTAFNSNGFSVGASNYIDTSTNGATVVAWQWKAGGSSSSNTNGSITSTVSVGATQGFSVVTFTAPASGNFSAGHGLGVTPGMVITKVRGRATSWITWHNRLNSGSPGTTYYVELNTTGGQSTFASVWGSTGVTSSVIGMGIGASCAASDTIVAYCFAAVAGYSAFGSYTGNGSADGPFVYTGFRPRFILWKRITTSGGHWGIIDSGRNPYNLANLSLLANAADGDATNVQVVDLLSNGFKVRTSDGGINLNNDTIIYAAFAENPTKYALAR